MCENHSVSGKHSNDGGVSLPYSEAGTNFDSYVIENRQDMVNRHEEEISKEVEAVQHEKGQNGAVNKELQKTLNLTERITSTTEVHNKEKRNSKGKAVQQVPKLQAEKVAKKKVPELQAEKVVKVPWTPEQNKAVEEALLKNPKVKVAELQQLPLLKGRPKESVKSKLWILRGGKKKHGSQFQPKEGIEGEKPQEESQPNGIEGQKKESDPVLTGLMNTALTLLKKEILEKQESANVHIFKLLDNISSDLKEVKEDLREMKETKTKQEVANDKRG